MALANSGQITLGEIAAEFGGSAPHELSEYYSADSWSSAPSSGEIQLAADFYGGEAFSASGGSTNTYSGYQSHTYTSSGTFVVTGSKACNVMVLAGGGPGSGPYSSGGGGAGGMVIDGSQFPTITAGTHTVTVGGAGSDSYFAQGNGTFEVRAKSGGGGGGYRQGGGGGDGGCGGGGHCANNLQTPAPGGDSSQTLYADSYAVEYGYSGGAGTGESSNNAQNMSGGGGGGCQAGGGGGGYNGGGGGAGRANLYKTGSNETRGGGGGGGGPGGGGGGGSGGGGQAGHSNGADGDSGQSNTGSGGGAGCQAPNSYGGGGGSGIVIVRYAT